MKLIVGLGNPGASYAKTRHNIGFFALDSIAHENKAVFTDYPKFRASIAKTTINQDTVLLVKPTTFYNDTGESVQLIAHFYKITPNDIILLHDDIHLPIGTIRTRKGGRTAGNNGLKSVEQHIGDATYRLRIGTWTEQYTPATATTFVLGKIKRSEQAILNAELPTIHTIIQQFCNNQLVETTYQHRENSSS